MFKEGDKVRYELAPGGRARTPRLLNGKDQGPSGDYKEGVVQSVTDNLVYVRLPDLDGSKRIEWFNISQMDHPGFPVLVPGLAAAIKIALDNIKSIDVVSTPIIPKPLPKPDVPIGAWMRYECVNDNGYPRWDGEEDRGTTGKFKDGTFQGYYDEDYFLINDVDGNEWRFLIKLMNKNLPGFPKVKEEYKEFEKSGDALHNWFDSFDD